MIQNASVQFDKRHSVASVLSWIEILLLVVVVHMMDEDAMGLSYRRALHAWTRSCRFFEFQDAKRVVMRNGSSRCFGRTTQVTGSRLHICGTSEKQKARPLIGIVTDNGGRVVKAWCTCVRRLKAFRLTSGIGPSGRNLVSMEAVVKTTVGDHERCLKKWSTASAASNVLALFMFASHREYLSSFCSRKL